MRKNILLTISLSLLLPQLALGVEDDTDLDGLLDIQERRFGAELIATGGAHTCFVDAGGDREVTCWGDNSYGQSTVPTALENPVAITAGFFHTCAIEDTGMFPGQVSSALCWGRDDSDQSTVPPILLNPVAVTAGWYHTCALDANGAICWGNNDDGQSTAPALVNPVAISAGAWHTCAIDDSGVQCWGLNNDGETTVPTDLVNPVAITAGVNQTCAIDDNGLRCWGRDLDAGSVYFPALAYLPALLNPGTIVSNGGHTCVMGSSAVSCWGANDFGQSDVPVDLVSPKTVAVGWKHTCVVDAGGLRCWGDNSRGQSDVPPDLARPTPVDQGVLAAGGAHTCAIDPGATRDVSCWGYNVNGQNDVPTDLVKPVALAGGWFHTCAIDDDGGDKNVRCWGNNGTDGIGGPTDQGQGIVPGDLVNPVAIATGAYHTCSNDDSGVRCWGVNDHGQTDVPAGLVSPTLPVANVSAGGWHACAIDSDGVVHCWGRNDHGQSTVPDPALVNPVAIAAGGLHTCAIDDSGVVCWGNDTFNQITDIPVLVNPVAIAADGGHTCAIDDSGVHCWGQDDFGQSTVPASLVNPVVVATGWSHTCAVDDNGVICWGANGNGEITVPQAPGLYRVATNSNPLNEDTDGDGLLDGADAYPLASIGTLTDTDGDGAPDSCDQTCTDAGMAADADDDGNGIIDVEEFVSRFYLEVLSRAADDAGLAAWVDQLQTGAKVGADIAYGFIFSEEFINRDLNDSDYLDVLYLAFFNRAPDDGGKNSWLSQLAADPDRNAVLDGFTGSQEFTNLSDSFGIKPRRTPVELFVTRFYQQTLLREPDTAGLDDWSAQLNAGTRTGADIAFGFIFSQEFINRNLNNSDFLFILYRAFFGREPDQGGFDAWLAQLDAGVPRLDVLNGFIFATEFANLASSFGITAFTVAQPMQPSMLAADIPVSASGLTAIDPGSLTGIWSSTSETDWGISITHDETNLLVAIYTFDTNGFPIWYMASNCAVSSNGCASELYEITGGSPLTDAWNGSNVQVTAIGSVELSFTDEHNGLMHVDVNGIGVSKTITRQVSSATLPNNIAMTGPWLNASESGWFVTLIQQSNIIFALVYTYDSNGFPIWYVAYNCPIANHGCTGNLYAVTGGSAITDSWNGANLNVTKVGSISFTLDDTDNAIMVFEIHGVSGSKQIMRQIWVPEY